MNEERTFPSKNIFLREKNVKVAIINLIREQGWVRLAKIEVDYRNLNKLGGLFQALIYTSTSDRGKAGTRVL